MTQMDVLQKYFGYDSFREGQEKLTSAILNGNDVLGIMPTGAGKSLCFQVPAIMQDGITIVVSPLISLMKDQVRSLTQAGIEAAYINSTLSPIQIEETLQNAKNGNCKIIYVAPERLLNPRFLDFTQNTTIFMVTVDEAHCISQWGQDFRPSYAQIPSFIGMLKNRPVVSAFTATATLRVKEDIIALLSLQTPTVLVTGFNRENLYFEIDSAKDKITTLIDFLRKDTIQSGIVYCSTRKAVEAVCEELNVQGFIASRYHAGLSDRERHSNQDDFLYDRVNIMVATNAFGMGIDKSNVSFVVHYNMPKDIESYYQEAGRAGRDGNPATCLLLYSGQDVRTNQWMIENSKDVSYPDEETEKLLKENQYKRLKEMTFYSTTNDCLRGSILRYFGEKPPNYCGHCSNCDTNFESVDITVDAQKILSCVYRMKERFGITMVIDVLRGSKNERIQQLGFNNLSTYGISEKKVNTLRAIIDHLLQTGYLQRTDEQYSVLQLTPASADILYKKVSIEMKLANEKIKEEAPKIKTPTVVSKDREELYTSLRNLRTEIAKEQGVPAYVIFSDNSLSDMCHRLPRTSSQFTRVSGVGERKLESYGSQFLRVIIDFCEEHEIAEIPESAEDLVPKRSKKQKASKEIVLPDTKILQEIELSDEPLPVSILATKINATLKLYDCTIISAAKISLWLISMGYLQIIETATGGTKIPTEKGFENGITQEERRRSFGTYSVNLYPKTLQKMIVDNFCDILSIDKNQVEEAE